MVVKPCISTHLERLSVLTGSCPEADSSHLQKSPAGPVSHWTPRLRLAEAKAFHRSWPGPRARTPRRGLRSLLDSKVGSAPNSGISESTAAITDVKSQLDVAVMLCTCSPGVSLFSTLFHGLVHEHLDHPTSIASYNTIMKSAYSGPTDATLTASRKTYGTKAAFGLQVHPDAQALLEGKILASYAHGGKQCRGHRHLQSRKIEGHCVGGGVWWTASMMTSVASRQP